MPPIDLRSDTVSRPTDAMHKDYALPKNYTIFGQVTKGLDVVDTIAAGRTGAQDRPVEPVAMTGVAIHED